MPCNQHYQSDPGFHRLYVFGAGGSGREIAWLAEQSWGTKVELVFLVDQPEFLVAAVNGVKVMLVQDVVVSEGDRFVVAMGNPALRLSLIHI